MALDSNDIAIGATLPGASAPQPSTAEAGPRFDARQFVMSALTGAGRLVSRGWIARAIGKSLRRRILLANLLGLAGLLFAMLYLSLHHGWLLDAKVDVVKTVSRMTSEAIAYRAVNERHAPTTPALFSFDGNPLNDWIGPWLNSVRVPHEKLGPQVVEALEGIVTGQPPRAYFVPFELTRR